MGRDGAEGTAAEATAMERDGEFYHLIGRNALTFIFWMRHTLIRQVEGSVNLRRRHGGIRGIDNNIAAICLLNETRGMHLVRFFLDVAEILCLTTAVFQALLVRMEHDVALNERHLVGNIYRLWNVLPLLTRCFAEGYGSLLAHAVGDKVGTGRKKYGWHEFVLPVIVMGKTAQRSLNAAKHNGNIGEELLQNLRIYYGGIFGSAVVTAIGRIGILGTQTLAGGVFVHHRVHRPWRDAKEQTRTTKLLEVAKVAVPVGLRNDSDTIAMSLKGATYDGSTKRRVVNIGIGREEYDIELVPATQVTFLLGRRQKVCQHHGAVRKARMPRIMVACITLSEIHSKGNPMTKVWTPTLLATAAV